MSVRARVETRVLHLAERLITQACRSLPDPERERRYREWTAELPAILDDTDRAWALRLLTLLTYAGDQQRGRTQTGRQLLSTVLSALVGAVVGAVGGAAVGCLIGWLIQGVAVDADINDRMGGLFQGGNELFGGGLVGRLVLVVCMVVAGVGGGLLVVVGPSWRRATIFGRVVGGALALAYGASLVGDAVLAAAPDGDNFDVFATVYSFSTFVGIWGLIGAVGYAVFGVVGSVIRWRAAAVLGWVACGLLLAGSTLDIVSGWICGRGFPGSGIGLAGVGLLLGGGVLRILSRGTGQRKAAALGRAGGGTLLTGGALGLLGPGVASLGLLVVGVGLVVAYAGVSTFSTIAHRRVGTGGRGEA